jgi:hypothetical protein
MANATVLRSSLTAIIPRLRTQLAAVTGLPEGRVRYVARQQKTPHFSAPRDLLIEDAGFEGDPGNSDRHDCRLLRRLAVTIRTRCELGEADADEPWALDADEGNIAFEELVIDAVQNFFPEDDDRNILTYEPMKVLRGEVRKREKDGWGEVRLVFHAGNESPMDQART